MSETEDWDEVPTKAAAESPVELKRPRTTKETIFMFLGYYLFFLLLFALPLFIPNPEEKEAEKQCLALVEQPIIDTVFVHYVLQKERDLLYQNIVEDKSGDLSFLTLDRALTIGATYEVAINCVSATIKSELESQKPLKSSTPKSPAPIARGFRFRNLL